MMIYEVNLTIETQIYEDYLAWLHKHIEAMLMFTGFINAELAEEKSEHTHKKLTVRYYVETEEDLENYLNHHANKMRSEAITQFGNQFTATRRIFQHMKHFK